MSAAEKDRKTLNTRRTSTFRANRGRKIHCTPRVALYAFLIASRGPNVGPNRAKTAKRAASKCVEASDTLPFDLCSRASSTSDRKSRGALPRLVLGAVAGLHKEGTELKIYASESSVEIVDAWPPLRSSNARRARSDVGMNSTPSRSTLLLAECSSRACSLIFGW